MKNFFFTLIGIFGFYYIADAQNNYNQELEKAAKEISQKITISEKKSVAVLDFENSNKQISELGSWLASVFTTHLENNSNNVFIVKNRTDIEKAIQQIKSESGSGAYDSKTIQRLGEISGSDVIVYGEITLMDNEITLNIRTKNISLNSTIGGTIVSFNATEGMRTKYDNYIESKSSSVGNNTTNSGTSSASYEGTPRTSKNPNCKEENTGDYSFQNSTKYKLNVKIDTGTGYSTRFKRCTLQPGEKQCFYDIQSRSVTYEIFTDNEQSGGYNVNYGIQKQEKGYNSSGTLYVEACKEKIFIIK